MQKLCSNLAQNSFLSKTIKFVNINSFCAIVQRRDRTTTKKQTLLL